jgi:lantibiotic modifying enzyme
VSRGDTLSWRTTNAPREQALTGLSHGAAGIGCALLELFRTTENRKFLRAAESAFRYEGRWFNEDRGNWPDLREISGPIRAGKQLLPYPVFWCHGAAGIALTRLRAWQIRGTPEYKAEALAALRTTESAVRDSLDSPGANSCLCHGTLGNSEVLLTGEEILGREFASGASTAREAALAGIRRSRSRAAPASSDQNAPPGLMLGLAGTGLFYLRICRPAIGPVLMPFGNLTPQIRRFAVQAADSKEPALTLD